jgi:hypothetical protein
VRVRVALGGADFGFDDRRTYGIDHKASDGAAKILRGQHAGQS